MTSACWRETDARPARGRSPGRRFFLCSNAGSSIADGTVVRTLAQLVAVSLLLAACVALAGTLFGYLTDHSIPDSISYALWLTGAILLLFTGLSGSPSRNLVQGRTVVGGRFYGKPLARIPFGFALVGFVLVGIGTLVYVLA